MGQTLSVAPSPRHPSGNPDAKPFLALVALDGALLFTLSC